MHHSPDELEKLDMQGLIEAPAFPEGCYFGSAYVGTKHGNRGVACQSQDDEAHTHNSQNGDQSAQQTDEKVPQGVITEFVFPPFTR